MEPLRFAIERTLRDFIERLTGVCVALKPSKKAHLASSAFLREDAVGTAQMLNAHAHECTLYGAPLLASVEAQNGWLLFRFAPDAIDAYAKLLPQIAEPDDRYFSRRLWMYARHDDAPVPDDPAVLQGFFAVLFGLPEGERLFLSAPRQKDGLERVNLEQRMTRLAKILIWERR